MFSIAAARRIAIAAVAVSGVMCSWLLFLHLRMIVSTAPQEMREGGILWITRLMLDGRNPYTAAELPASTNVYGVFYHLVVMPFAWLFGNGFIVHRVVSGLAIAGSCVLLFRLLKQRADALLAITGVMLFYASSVYFVAPLARPDALAVFLGMASMTVLFRDGVTPVYFLMGLALALLALVTKTYLAFPPFVMSAYVFVFESPRRGALYGLLTISAAAALLLLMTRVYPAYLTVSIIVNAQTMTYYDFEHMRQQTLDWMLFSLPLVVGVAVALGRLVAERLSTSPWRRPDIYGFAAIANAIVYFIWFAGHPGAHMTYLFHLVTPVLLVAVMPALAQTAWPRAAFAAALPVAFYFNAHYVPTFASFSAAERTFAQLRHTIEAHRNVLGSTEVAGLLVLAGRPVIDSGQSQYFRDAVNTGPIPRLLPASLVQARWEEFIGTIENDIRQQRFDLIVRSRRPGLIPRNLVSEHYVRTGSFDVTFPWSTQHWPLDLWEPSR